jgi:arylsulfatase A-like enzyme
MNLPLWQEGELDNKPPFHKEDYLYGAMDRHAPSIIGMTDYQKKENKRDYYAQIELIDAQMGRLMNYLDEKGLRENTIVIFMSDHGELDGDHGVYFKGPYFYESLVHVPLIISCPGTILCGKKSKALVELVDIAPTLLELTGIKVPFYIQGKSFAGLLTGKTKKDEHKQAVYCEFYDCLTNVAYKGYHATMYFDGRFKIVVHHSQNWGELYDLVVDPDEYKNLWFDPTFRDLKYELIKRNFDNAIMCNSDKVLNPCWDY